MIDEGVSPGEHSLSECGNNCGLPIVNNETREKKRKLEKQETHVLGKRRSEDNMASASPTLLTESQPTSPIPPTMQDLDTTMDLDQNGQPGTPNEQVPLTAQSNLPKPIVVIIHLAGASKNQNFQNPAKLHKALANPELAELLKIDTVTVLGAGKALRVEMDRAKYDGAGAQCLKSLTKLGDWDIVCRIPASNFNDTHSYGVIAPIDTESNLEELQSMIQPLWCDTEILQLERLKRKTINDNNRVEWVESKSVKITFRGSLPTRVVIGYTTYPVSEYTFPLSRCTKCLEYGHSPLTCKNPQRCSKCSHYGHTKAGCDNDPYCVWCHQSHIPGSFHCRTHSKAVELNKNNNKPSAPDIKKQL